MTTTRRVLFVSELPLTASAQSFLGRSSIAVETAETFKPGAARSDGFDLVVVDDSRIKQPLAQLLDEYDGWGAQLLVLSKTVPDDSLLSKAAAFLVAPYSQSELIGAIGDLLGTELRRALRLGVVLGGVLGRSGDRTANATILQISENGCLFEVDSPVQVGEAVTISFVLPSTGEELVLVGSVVSGNELQLLYGLRFDAGLESERLAILVFVELGLAAGGSELPGVGEEAAG